MDDAEELSLEGLVGLLQPAKEHIQYAGEDRERVSGASIGSTGAPAAGHGNFYMVEDHAVHADTDSAAVFDFTEYLLSDMNGVGETFSMFFICLNFLGLRVIW